MFTFYLEFCTKSLLPASPYFPSHLTHWKIMLQDSGKFKVSHIVFAYVNIRYLTCFFALFFCPSPHWYIYSHNKNKLKIPGNLGSQNHMTNEVSVCIHIKSMLSHKHTSVKKTLKTSFKSHHLKVILLTKRHGTNVSYICIIMKQKWSAYTKPVHLSYVKIKNACFIYIFHYNDDGWFFSSTFLSENFITFEV